MTKIFLQEAEEKLIRHTRHVDEIMTVGFSWPYQNKADTVSNYFNKQCRHLEFAVAI
jgi:hypothetical protein